MIAPRPHDNSLRVVSVSDAAGMSHAYAIRAICFMQEGGLSAAHAFDGNDFHASHFVYYLGDEPIGASRVRYFPGFAKIERTGFRKPHNNVRTIKRCTDQVFAQIARKGYRRVVTFAEEKYAALWARFFHFEYTTGTPVRRPDQEVAFFEMHRDLDVPGDAISDSTHPKILVRVEGAWDVPASFG